MQSPHVSTEVWAFGLHAGLPKLQRLELHGPSNHRVAEEKPGLLKKVLDGLKIIVWQRRSQVCLKKC